MRSHTEAGCAKVVPPPADLSASNRHPLIFCKWYLLEVEFSGTTAIGRLYDSNGTTLLNTTSYNYGESLVGNVVVRGFGSADIDTLVQCK